MGQKPRAARWWHTSVNASIPICISPFISAHSQECAAFFKREKGLQSLKTEKRLRQKSRSGHDNKIKKKNF